MTWTWILLTFTWIYVPALKRLCYNFTDMLNDLLYLKTWVVKPFILAYWYDLRVLWIFLLSLINVVVWVAIILLDVWFEIKFEINKVSSTLYPAHIRELRSPTFCRILEALRVDWQNSTSRCTSVPERKNGNIDLNKYFISSSGDRTHNQSVLQSHFVSLRHDWPQ